MIGNSIRKSINVNTRIAGNGAKEGELRTGGTYVPAYIRADGKFIPARWFGQFCVNANYLDGKGALIEKRHFIDLTVWNGRNTESGEKMGMADVFAKNASVGREIKYMETRDLPYTDNVYDNVAKKDALKADGTPLTCDKCLGSELINADTFSFGAESDAEIARQEALWTADMTGKASFFARPSGMDAVARTAFHSLKKSVKCTAGAKYFGYARVGSIPKGARLAHETAAAGAVAVPGAVANANTGIAAMLGNADLTNPAVIAALAALGLNVGSKVATASPAVEEMETSTYSSMDDDGVPY